MDGKHSRQLRPVQPVHHRQDADDDLKAASQSADEAVDYKQYMPKLKPEHKVVRRVVKIVVLVVVIAGFGTGAYIFGSHYNADKNALAVKTATASSSKTNKITAPTKMYSSTNQNLSFVYPSNWKVNETATTLTATSPAMKLTSYSRQTVTGKIVFRIRTQGSSLPEFSSGSATAALNSQLITYTAPTADQQASTYVSFLNYANSKGFGIDGIYVTANAGYQEGQPAPESDIAAVSPIISFTFVKCGNKSCSSTTPLTIASQSWSTKNFSSPLLAMLESLSIN
jgi:hypothetical protein